MQINKLNTELNTLYKLSMSVEFDYRRVWIRHRYSTRLSDLDYQIARTRLFTENEAMRLLNRIEGKHFTVAVGDRNDYIPCIYENTNFEPRTQ